MLPSIFAKLTEIQMQLGEKNQGNEEFMKANFKNEHMWYQYFS